MPLTTSSFFNSLIASFRRTVAIDSFAVAGDCREKNPGLSAKFFASLPHINPVRKPTYSGT